MSRPMKYRKRAPDITPQRIEVLQALTLFWNTNGYPPSLGELADQLSLRSRSTVWNHLENLQRQGLVCKTARSARGWRPAA